MEENNKQNQDEKFFDVGQDTPTQDFLKRKEDTAQTKENNVSEKQTMGKKIEPKRNYTEERKDFRQIRPSLSSTQRQMYRTESTAAPSSGNVTKQAASNQEISDATNKQVVETPKQSSSRTQNVASNGDPSIMQQPVSVSEPIKFEQNNDLLPVAPATGTSSRNSQHPPVSQKEKSLKKKSGTKKKQTVIVLGFVAALLCACILLAVGINLMQSTQKKIAQDPTLLPTLNIQDPPEGEGTLTTTQIAEKVKPSVVTINTYEQGDVAVYATGSGVIFSEDGYILTNAHVIEGAYAIRVILDDGTGYTAQLVGVQEKRDLAVLKVNAEGLVPAEFGNSDNLQLGERVVTVGNPMGIFPSSTTQGIISGINREIPTVFSDGSSGYLTLIQTDAAINPGNSGGALVNSYGQVVGINVLKVNIEAVENIGFAIPSNSAQDAISLIFEENDTVITPSIGFVVVELNETNGPAEGLPSSGLYIEEVLPGSDLNNSSAMGVGDVVTEVNGQIINTSDELTAILSGLQVGDTITLTGYCPHQDKGISETVILKDPSILNSTEESTPESSSEYDYNY